VFTVAVGSIKEFTFQVKPENTELFTRMRLKDRWRWML